MLYCISRLKDALGFKDCIYITKEFRYTIVRGRIIKTEVRECAK